jgi:hypothetical protein
MHVHRSTLERTTFLNRLSGAELRPPSTQEVRCGLLPVTPNPGATVLTTGGYALLLSPFPIIATDGFGQSGSPGFLTTSALSGSAGVYGLLPGNSAGIPGLGTTAPNGSNGGGAVTINIGSGTNDAGAANIPPVTRNTVANDALTAAPVIGHVSGDQPAVLPPEQVHRGGLPVTATVDFPMEAPGRHPAKEPAHGPVDPLPLTLRRRPHRLGSGGAGNIIRSHAVRAP